MNTNYRQQATVRLFIAALTLTCTCAAQQTASTAPADPGVRAGAAAAGTALTSLSGAELAAFTAGQAAFQEVDDIAEGLGPRFNSDSCSSCHAFPAIGGSSPAVNPQVALATKLGARNQVPSFITSTGPVREVRFKVNSNGLPDGGVHALFTIAGRTDAPGCSMAQPDFSNSNNLSFRIPTPTFGLGLIEAITDTTLSQNLATNSLQKSQLGISGRLNTNGNDGTMTRFGWKAQNKSLVLFSAEAYNVEQGVTNLIFTTERDETAGCSYAGGPEDGFAVGAMTDVLEFANFMRFLAPPAPVATAATANGAALFNSVGCAYCHTPTLVTGRSAIAALNNQPVNLYSDLAVHNMGFGLADGITQGSAGPFEFRTAPLWGLGQRIFFLHDGRSKDLLETIRLHASLLSEANAVINNFNQLSPSQQQDILNFLRSL